MTRASRAWSSWLHRAPPVGYPLFFLSGFTALALEVLWLRELQLLFGSTAYATSVVLATLFLGIGLGGHLWGRYAARSERPLRTYGLLELGVASMAALLLFLFRGPYPDVHAALSAGLSGRPPLMRGAHVLLAATALLPASTLLGGTFPLMAQHVIGARERLGTVGSGLYAVNTAGGVLGTLAVGFLLPPWLGYEATYLAATAVAAGVGGVAVLWSRHREAPSTAGQALRSPPRGGSHEPAMTAPPTSSRPFGERWTLVVALASGALVLGLEVAWTVLFAQVLQNSVYSFAAMTVVVLTSLTGGALTAAVLARRRPPSWALLAGLIAAGGLLTLVSEVIFLRATDGLSYLVVEGGWTAYVAATAGLITLTLLPGFLLLGTAFPYLLKLVEDRREAVGRSVGRLVAANGVGAVIGPLIVGFALLGRIGPWQTVGLLAGAYGALAVGLLWFGPGPRRLRGATLVVAGFAVGLLVVGPDDLPVSQLGSEDRLLGVWHGPDGTVTVVEREGNRELRLNNHYVVGDSRSAGNERMQAHIPLWLHPRPDSVYLLGLGTGITASGVLAHEPERLVATELVPEVLEAARAHFASFTGGLFVDPRAEILVRDGRAHLRGSSSRFDVVISDLFTPWHAGTAYLYSLEHFRDIRNHLRPGGVYALWLPLHQLTREEFAVVARTLSEVFGPLAVWRGNFSPEKPTAALIGTRDPAARPALAIFAENTRRMLPAVVADREHARALADLFFVAVLAPTDPFLAGHPLNTRDRPVLQFRSPASHARRLTSDSTGLVAGRLLELWEELRADTSAGERRGLGRTRQGAPALSEPGLGRAGLALYRYRVHRRTGSPSRADTAWQQFTARTPASLRQLVASGE